MQEPNLFGDTKIALIRSTPIESEPPPKLSASASCVSASEGIVMIRWAITEEVGKLIIEQGTVSVLSGDHEIRVDTLESPNAVLVRSGERNNWINLPEGQSAYELISALSDALKRGQEAIYGATGENPSKEIDEEVAQPKTLSWYLKACALIAVVSICFVTLTLYGIGVSVQNGAIAADPAQQIEPSSPTALSDDAWTP